MPKRPMFHRGSSVRVTPGKRSVLAFSFAVSMVVSFAVLAATVTGAGHIIINSGTAYTWAGGSTTTSGWATSTNWSPNGVPGSAVGDSVSFNSGNYSIAVQVTATDGISNPVFINNGGAGVTIQVAGGTLPLTGSSTFATSSMGPNTLRVDSGGTVTTPAAATIALNAGGFGAAKMWVNGGSVNLSNGSAINVNAGGSSAQLQFSGGTISGATNADTVNVTGPATTGGSIVCDGASGPMSFSGLSVNNNGLLNYTSSSAVNTLSFDSSAILNNNGELDLNNNNIFNNVSPATINNSVSGVTKSLGTGTAAIATFFNNFGTMKFASPAGTFQFSNGGTQTGAFQHNVSTVYMFGGGHTFNSGASITSCSGCSTTINGGGTTFADNVGLSIDNLTQNANSTLSGTGGTTLNGTFNWNGGTQSGSIGSTTLAATAAANFSGSGIMKLDSGRLFTIASGATVTYAPSTGFLEIDNSAGIKNLGTFTATNDVAISTLAGMGIFDNQGTLKKNGGTLTTTFGPFLNSNTNSGATNVNVQTGTLKLTGGGSFGGSPGVTITTSPGTTLSFGGTSAGYGMASGTSFASSGTISLVDSATLTPAVTLSIPTFVQDNASTLACGAANSDLSITATYTWHGGTMNGAGGPCKVSLAGSTQSMLIDGSSGPMTLTNGYGIQVSGSDTLTYTPVSGLSINNGAHIDLNGSSMILGNDTGIGSNLTGLPVINVNAGAMLSKNAGTMTSAIQVPVTASTATSTISVASGAIALAGGGTLAGNVTTVGATNAVMVPLAQVTLAGTANVNGLGTLLVNGGTLQANSPLALGSLLELKSGTVNGTGNLTLNSGMKWEGGTMSGTGHTVIPNGQTLDATAPIAALTLSGRTIDNNGNFNFDPTATPFALNFNSASVLNNNGTGVFDIRNNGTLLTDTPLSSGIFNAGIVKRSTGTGNFRIDVQVGNSGTLNPQTGLLQLNNGGFNTGAINTAAGAFTEVLNGTFLLNAGTSFTNTGTFKVNGGTLNVNTTLSVPTSVAFLSGTFNLNSPLTLTGPFFWGGGTINGPSAISAGVGNATVSPGVANAILNGTTFNNTGTTTMQGSSGTVGLQLTGGATFNNPNTFDVAGDRSIFGTPTETFANGGTFKKSAAGGTSSVATAFNNTGVVNVLSGHLIFASNGTDTGSYTGAASTILEFNGGTRTLSAAGGVGPFATPGSVLFTGGTFTDNGTYNVAGQTIINGGSLVLNTTSTPQTGAFALTAGSLGGSAGLLINGGGSWIAGTITSGPAMTIAVGGSLSIAPNTSNPTLDGRVINDNGTITYNSLALPLLVNNGGGFTTSASGNFLIQTNTAIQTTAGASTFVNQGTFSKTVGSGTTSVDFSFNNQGNVDLLSGTVDFKGGYTQSTGSAHTFLGGGNITSSFGALNINAGLLKGSGNVGTSVVNAGTLDPGVGPTTGTINITGNYTQTSGGTLHADLGGATMGQYDQLNVTGNANLAGNLNVANAGAFSAAAGNTFTILNFGSLTGDFTHPYTLPPVTGGTMQAAYAPVGTPTSLVLTAVGNADLGVTITGAPTVSAGQNGSFSVNAGNNGPAGAANPTLTVTTSTGSFVSAMGSGWTCTFSGNTASCTQPALANGAMAPLTVMVTAPPSGSVTINASIASTSPDPNNANNSATFTAGVTPAADMSVNKSGPSSASTGSQVTYSIIVTNNGPSPTTNVVLSDPTPSGMTFVSVNGGGCMSFPCTLGNMAAGQSISLSAKYQLGAGTSGSVSNTATVSSSVTDPIMTNNSSTVSTIVGCPIAPGNLLPANGVSNVPTSGMLMWNNTGAQSYNVYLGPAGSGCSTLVGSAAVAQFPYSGLQPGAYEWRVEAVTPNCPTKTSSCVTFTTSSSCATQPPTLIAPASGAAVSNPVTFTWSAVSGATSYDVFTAVGGGMATNIGTTSSTSLTAGVPSGTITWYVVANGVPGCGPLTSLSSSFNSCSLAVAPLASVVGEATSNQTYSVAWGAVPGASTYQVDQATNAGFTDVTTLTVMTTSVQYTHAATLTPQAFFYRVRAITDCNQQPGPNSTTVRVVIIPLPGRGQNNPSTNVPVGSTRVVVQQVFIPGLAGGLFTYSASTDQVWLTVSPPTGVLPIDGITLDVTADPANLPNGTFTATVIVSITQVGAAKVGSHAAAAVVSVPVSVNLVTPVTSGPGSSPQSNSLIIPSVGHLDGINSHWQSDIRLNNPTTDHQRYQLIFTPSGTDASTGVKTTTIDVNSGETTALDDIVRNWYGVGSLGDSANGFLEIRPIAPSGKGLEANAVDVTKAVASSRTYNVSNNGTLGQFIPAIPFASFIAKAAGTGAVAPILSLQQIAQSDAFRTNIGLVEASGQPASVLLSVFNSAGIKIQDFPISLRGSEQKQLNSFLAQNNIVLPDGRIQVQVTSGSGKVTAYASVIDNNSGVPLLVSGVPLGAAQNNHYVLPGVADLNTGGASWRTDMRIFNGGTTPQAASLVFYPQNVGGSSPSTQSVTINPGEVKTLDNILQSIFGQTNVGGAMHILTMSNSSLIVTGRTYNLTPNGTFGQFIPAVTPFDAVGKGDRSLQILQVEDSVRYRTNLGLAEVTGNAVSVEVTIVLPDSKVTPKLTFTMQPNEFRQIGIIRDLGLGNTYNARISVRVLDGDGRVTAYGSVIDMITQDPTYVPAQ
jgi:uncharacterized repeat protein (TIGR01451 family)